VDLPILRGPWDRLPAALRAELLGETARLSHLDPALLADVSEIRVADSSAHALLLTHRLADIVLPVGAGSDRLAELHAVLTDLEGRLPASGADAAPARVDLRYGEQVVVRIPSSVSVL
jgi:hypothetical protein